MGGSLKPESFTQAILALFLMPSSSTWFDGIWFTSSISAILLNYF